MLKIYKLSEMLDFSEEETAGIIARCKARYQAEIDALGATPAIRDVAREIAARRTSCKKCVYCDGRSAFCHIPYSDLTMETLGIDPCYDGVLRFLMRRGDGGDDIARGNRTKKRDPVH